MKRIPSRETLKFPKRQNKPAKEKYKQGPLITYKDLLISGQRQNENRMKING